MNELQIIRLTFAYRKLLRDDLQLTAIKNGTPLEHCLWMLESIPVFMNEGKRDKAHRWLGFIQGVLWMERVFTIEEMAGHNTAPATIYASPLALESLAAAL